MSTRLLDHLRELTDDQLTALLAARPDLAVPVPGDLSALSSRAQSRLSLARALEGLDQFTLEILDALRLAAPHPTDHTTFTEVRALAEAVPAARVRSAVDRLRELAVAYGPDDELRVVRGVAELCPPYPAGLGRPAAELDPLAGELMADPSRLRRELLSTPPAARALLDRLAAGPPVGTTREGIALADGGEPDGPVGWLVSHHLLVRERVDTVQLPRELGLLLRRDTGPLGVLHPDPPPLDPPVRNLDAVDSAGAGQVMEAVRLTAALLDALAAEPAPVLKSGGLGVRDLRRLARAADATEPIAALLLELARETDLIADGTRAGSDRAAGGDGTVWLPTPQYDLWRGSAPSARWLRLIGGWLGMARAPGLIGTREEKDRPVNALSGEVSRMSAPLLRTAVLTALAELPEGSAPADEDLVALLTWRAPRRGGTQAPQAARWILAEAATLGLTGRAALTRYGRLLLAGRPAARAEDPLGVDAWHSDNGPDPAELLDELLPAPVDRVLLQADLTIVVPGPPEQSLADELDLLADPESAGHATVYRVTPASVRRALDAGLSATDLHALFARRSSTPVPQALSYLVDDVARRHGGLRVGSCAGYLRSEDTALLAELLADRRLGVLGLRQIAPTVLVSPYQVHRMLELLRDAGYAPVAEDTGGVVVSQRPELPRGAAVRRVHRSPRELPDRLTLAQLGKVVAALRRGEQAARASRRASAAETDPASTTDALAVLQQAIRDRQRIWVGYVDAHGGTASRLVRPVSIGAGYLRAADDRSETLHTFALHRITSATPAEV